MRRLVLAALALGLASPALGAQAPAPPAAAPAPDPARVAAAERLARLMVPEGAMRRALAGGIPGADVAMNMSANDLGLGEVSGMSAADRDRSLAELSEARDPHFRERMEITQRIAGEVMVDVMAGFEPELRQAYAGAFARRFSTAEMGELIAFFSTPTGGKYAEMAITVTQDPFFVETMQGLMPRLVEAGRLIDERVRAATAHLPPPPADPEDSAEPAEAGDEE